MTPLIYSSQFIPIQLTPLTLLNYAFNLHVFGMNKHTIQSPIGRCLRVYIHVYYNCQNMQIQIRLQMHMLIQLPKMHGISIDYFCESITSCHVCF